MINLSKRNIKDIQQALVEASDVIFKFEQVTTKSNLPNTFRYPMVDELDGLALMLEELLRD